MLLTIVFTPLSFSVANAVSSITAEVFDSACNKSIFIITDAESQISLRPKSKNIKVSGKKSSLVERHLINTKLLAKADSGLLVATNQATISNIEKITCHRQHCSYWIDFSKQHSYKDRKKVSILLDPGHGGIDPGASHYGLLEKNITLSFANSLSALLHSRNIQVQLTRTADRFLSLKERSFIASKVSPDCFISLHADSYTDKSVSGASVFMWGNDKRSQSALNKYLLESNEDLNFLGDSDKGSKKMLLPILNELVHKVQDHNTSLLGEILIKNLSQKKMHSSDVQKAPFYVLNNPATPSLLIELGFLSHRKSALMLSSEEGQRFLSQQIAHGITQYAHEVYPNIWTVEPVEYIVKSGDTLWSISRAHHVSVDHILKINNLKNNLLKIDQKLLI